MSVASEIARIKNAKASLKTSINAKTDQQHQITNETIDDYSDFVDSITTGGGADLSDYFTLTITKGTSNMGGFANMIKSIPSTTTIDGTDLSYAFSQYKGSTIPLINTSNVIAFERMFIDAINLTTIPLIDTSKGVNFANMFFGCSSITTIPLIDTSRATNVGNMFNSCTNLTTIPIFDFSGCNRLYNTFANCPNFTDTSLDNILKICINSNVTSTSRKTLVDVGFTSTVYPASRIQALPSYQDFIDAGWTIGY